MLAAAIWACTAASVARADVVSAQGRPLVVNVKITALKDGQLSYQTDAGHVTRPIEQIRYLQISGWDAFNLAERQQRDGQARLAIAGYEKILEGGAAGGAPGNVDRRLLVQCRLAHLYDVHEQFDAAVGAYLAVVQSMPAVVETLRPTHVLKSGPQLARAAEMVEKAVAERDRLDPIAMSLEQWRATWPDVAGGDGSQSGRRPSTGAARPSAGATARPGAGDARAARTKGELEILIEAGRFQEAIDRVTAAGKAAPISLQAETYYWQGRAYLGIAGKTRGEEAQAARRRAGLAFMRVAILSPESPLAPECLFRAGEICRDEGRADRAAALWTELIAAYAKAAPWTQQARQAMAKLRTAASAPAVPTRR